MASVFKASQLQAVNGDQWPGRKRQYDFGHKKPKCNAPTMTSFDLVYATRRVPRSPRLNTDCSVLTWFHYGRPKSHRDTRCVTIVIGLARTTVRSSFVYSPPLDRSTRCREINRPSSSSFKASSNTASRQLQADDRMRVKKLSSNRRHKAGEEEGGAAAGDSDQRRWVSPSKSTRGAAATGSNSGTSSPTDVQQQQQQQHFGEHSPLQLQTSSSPDDVFVAHRGTGGATAMPNAAAADVAMQEDTAADKNPKRKIMTRQIEETLRALKPHAPEKVLARLPALAKHMEKALYKVAQSEAEYSDVTTLRLRITRIQENSAKRLLAQQQPSPEQSNDTHKPLTEEQARVIYQHLQSWRQKLVNMYGVAPWDILPNPTLAKVALYVPSSEQELAVCGMEGEQLARFGASLLQELQSLRPTKPANRPIKTKQARKASPGKRGSSEVLPGSNKKRKSGEVARLAPAAAPGPSFNGTSLLAPASLLPAVDSLPTLLPTVSMIPGGVSGATASSTKSMARLSPSPVTQNPFFARLQPQQQQPQTPPEDNHMHLLVQGAGQLSKQSSAKSSAAYEQELQSLRWMLHQAHEDKARLESEVRHLRTQLQQRMDE